jgi:hypothetical protein
MNIEQNLLDYFRKQAADYLLTLNIYTHGAQFGKYLAYVQEVLDKCTVLHLAGVFAEEWFKHAQKYGIEITFVGIDIITKFAKLVYKNEHMPSVQHAYDECFGKSAYNCGKMHDSYPAYLNRVCAQPPRDEGVVVSPRNIVKNPMFLKCDREFIRGVCNTMNPTYLFRFLSGHESDELIRLLLPKSRMLRKFLNLNYLQPLLIARLLMMRVKVHGAIKFGYFGPELKPALTVICHIFMNHRVPRPLKLDIICRIFY